MFDVGFLELMLIGVVGLLVLGPERLPKAARTAGLWIGKAKRTVANMQREINAQLEAEELRQKLSEQEKKLNAGLGKARRELEGVGEPRRADNGGRPDADEARQQAAHEPVEPATTPVDSDPTPTAADKDSTPR
ncbi:Sec-independent protein translocase protein TatB [Halomonas sp. HP20-15]|uniref:Sec-independent protein translocase protein TatB n=1 Tax=Halomonas sp. HP20-15 TaxID=3085901 RepID=UPI002982124A|nr:Sec-independent protein translocase protein TatB [Halomonas sp. HP20-15]MDW5376347.1 Sec-independent protein translocase protein TatB [Halomonas sp. HP20-15]